MMQMPKNLYKRMCYIFLCIYIAINSVESLQNSKNLIKNEIHTTSDKGKNLPEVQIESGRLVGTHFRTDKGRQVYAFLGVPYAAPPINEYRFREPQMVKSWQGKREANQRIKKCSQLDQYRMSSNQKSILGTEDCLYLNIYTPQLFTDNETTTLLEVIIYIHGGAFMYGTADTYQPKYLLDKTDLVFVAINYRLGPFGFLTMEDDIIPGNNGLKDQAFALKWIQNNIRQFSGDPNKVTIAGMSAGGASVNFHYLSKQSRDLFSKGISISGVASNPWALMEAGREKTMRLAESLDCSTKNSTVLLKCLERKSDYEILSKIKSLFMPWLYNPFSPFGPTIEKTRNNPFLDENPKKMQMEGKTKDAPWLVSITSEEGLFPGAEFIDNDNLLKQLNNNWFNIAPSLLDYNYTVAVNKQNMISKLIREYYFANKSISSNTTKEIIDLLGDRLFLVDIGKIAKLQAVSTKSNTYMYKFSFRGTNSISEFLTRSNKNYGVSHGDDLPYILGCYFNKIEMEDEIEVLNRMVNIWITFIKHGKPESGNGSEWHPISKLRDSNEIDYLNIKSYHEMNMVTEKNFGNRNFWDSLDIMENNY